MRVCIFNNNYRKILGMSFWLGSWHQAKDCVWEAGFKFNLRVIGYLHNHCATIVYLGKYFLKGSNIV